jgi:hypothetical protein
MAAAMRTLRLHLDTSDYAVMYNAGPGTEAARIRDHLKDLAWQGAIAIGLSYHVVFELLQDAPPKYRDDRLARARLLSELCGPNAFPYPSDLGQGYRFSTDGLWVPRIDLEDTEIEKVLDATIAGIRRHPALPREQRRSLARRKTLVAWARDDPAGLAQLAGECWPLLFARSFAQEGGLGCYLLGTLRRDDANKILWRHFTDPVSVYMTWFELYGRANPIADRRDRMAEVFMKMLTELGRMLDEETVLRARVKGLLADTDNDEPLETDDRTALSKLTRDLKAFRTELSSPEEMNKQVPRWKEMVGEESALTAAQIFQALHREKRGFKRSDAIDFIHAMYLPHTDLWRGDKAFSDLLIKHKIDLSDRVVPTLADLPTRIDAEIARRREAGGS